MANPAQNRSTGTISGLVSIGTHSLFLSASGPSRIPGFPAVILEAGSGSNHLGYAAIARHVSAFARIYTYDRSGLGLSEVSPSQRDAATLAAELSSLLKMAGISGPYVMVAHSYGGIIAREFLELKKEEVVGMVLVDTNHERSWELKLCPFEELGIMFKGLDEIEVLGLKETNRLTAEEWDAFVTDESGDSKARMKEINAVHQSHTNLLAKMQLDRQVLGKRPLSVIKGSKQKEFMKLYEAGVKRGNGTEELREFVKNAIERLGPLDEELTRDQLRLSQNNRYVYAKNSGHEVELTEPELVAGEVKWVLGEIDKYLKGKT